MAAPTTGKSFKDILNDMETLISAKKELPGGGKVAENISRMIEDSSRQLDTVYQLHTSREEPSCQDHSHLLSVYGSIEGIPVSTKILRDMLKSEVIARRVLQVTPRGCSDFQAHKGLQRIWESLIAGDIQDKAVKTAVLEAFVTHSGSPRQDEGASGSRQGVEVPSSGSSTNDRTASGRGDKVSSRRSDRKSTQDERARFSGDEVEVPESDRWKDERVSGSRRKANARRSEGSTKGATKAGWSIPVATVRFPDKLLWGECLAIIYDAARGFLVAQDVDKAKAKAGSGVEVAISRLTHLFYCPSKQYIQLHLDGLDRFVLDIKMHVDSDGHELIEKILYNGPQHCVVNTVENLLEIMDERGPVGSKKRESIIESKGRPLAKKAKRES